MMTHFFESDLASKHFDLQEKNIFFNWTPNKTCKNDGVLSPKYISEIHPKMFELHSRVKDLRIQTPSRVGLMVSIPSPE